jgi:uncharacterized protein
MVYKNVPGVFVKEVSLLPPSVAGVATGIPAFIGYTAKRKTLKGEDINGPLRILSMREYEDNFGKGDPENDLVVSITDTVAPDGSVLERKIEADFKKTTGKPSVHNMYYSLQLFFANGGGPCYIISIGDKTTPFPGTISKADLSAGLTQLESEDEPTMIVIPEAVNLTSDGDYFGIYNEALKQCADLMDRVTIIDVKQSNNPITTDISTNFRKDAGGLQVDYLRFGAAYYPYLATTVDYDYTGKEGDIKIEHKKVKSTDGTADGNGDQDGKFLNAIPNLLKIQCKDALSQIPIKLPPSPAMAGVYARVDSERGVWKAPANVGISSIIGPDRKVTDADQDYMNIDPTSGKSVNAIRTISGRGTVVWGARTLDGNSNEWRYISVRRFFNYVEESVKKASYRFVFEPNDANTWVKVRGMIENFLILQWRDGALMGAKPEQAFFVRVGVPQTMTENDVNEGRMIVEIGMAVVRPAEFIILKFSHKMMTQS